MELIIGILFIICAVLWGYCAHVYARLDSKFLKWSSRFLCAAYASLAIIHLMTYFNISL